LGNRDAWRSFTAGEWQESVDVAGFIQLNYRPYEGDESFLSGPTVRTEELLGQITELLCRERAAGGVLDIATDEVTTVAAFAPGYIDAERELIVGLQTDRPLKRAVNPFGGMRMAKQACEAYGYRLSERVEEAFRFRTTHNDGVFRVYTAAMKDARRCGVITGLPDAYGRGRIIGDYRRVALYGVDRLIAGKQEDTARLSRQPLTESVIRKLEELHVQVHALEALKQMAAGYGHDIGGPATNAEEAVQWLYFAYLGALKEANGAAMSLGRVSTFLDIYIERDMAEGVLDESGAQELVDDLVLKLRIARQLRTPDYDELFAGDPLWITEAIGGMGQDGRTLVTRTSFRFLHTLTNLGSAPEPNMTVLWAETLPEPFKRYCARLSVATDAIQYENDDLMRRDYGDDYSIACCVSAMRVGKEMQFFGARCNLPKALLMALNGGRDEISGAQVGPETDPIKGPFLDYEEVMQRFDDYLEWLCELYVNTMNVIHFMHDKYAYESLQMSLHDTQVRRYMAFGIAGLSVVADSLSAIAHARVGVVRDDRGLITDFYSNRDFPAFGNDDDRADSIAVDVVQRFLAKLKRHATYRGAEPTLSILTITSNVVYGKKTGSTPDGRHIGEPFAPGANPMHNRDEHGALASLNSVAKIPYACCRDGISCTVTMPPNTLGSSEEARVDNLVGVLDGYFSQKAHHLNVNVLSQEQLRAAMEHPELYPNLTVRVSGYAVNFHRLSREQQEEVISRTFHGRL